MSALLKFEFRKLMQARVVYICAGILVLLIVIFMGTNKLTDMAVSSIMSEDFAEFEDMPEADDLPGYDASPGQAVPEENFEEDLNNSLTASMGLLSDNNGAACMLNALTNVYIIVVFAAFAAVFVCGDYGNGIIKNVLTKGYTRSEVYFTKYIVSLIVCFCYALIAYLTGFLCGTLMWNIGSSWSGKFVLLIFIQLLAVAAFNALFNFLAALFKRVGSVLAISIAMPIILSLLLSVLELLISSTEIRISNLWLSGALMLAASPLSGAKDLLVSAACSIVYGIIFTVLGWLLARKREV